MSCDEDVFDVLGFGWGELSLKVNSEITSELGGPSRLDLRPAFDRFFEGSRHGRWGRRGVECGSCDLQGDCWSCRPDWKTFGHSTEAIARAPLIGACRYRNEGVRWTRVYTQWDLLEAHALAVGRFFRHRALSPKFA